MSAESWIAGNGAKIPLELETLDDQFGKAIARHEYPHVDGGDLEDLGQTTRSVRLRAHFWDEPNHEGYDNHKALLALLGVSALLELNHPRYGLLKGKVDQVSVRHDDAERYAAVDFNFVQQLREEAAAVQVVDVAATMEAAWQAALERELERIEAGVVEELGGQASEVLDVELDEDPEASILDQFTGISRAAWAYVKKADAAVRTYEGTLADVVVPANSLLSTIDFATSLPGRLLQATAGCVERYTILAERLSDAPYRLVDGIRGGLLQLENSLPSFSSHLRAAGAARACLALGDTFAADDAARRNNEATARVPAFDPRGNRVPSAPRQAVLTVGEMEAAAALCRTWIQEAVDLDRSRTELKTMARALIEHLNDIKVEREKLVAVELAQPLPLHLVCLGYGMSYRDAERLLAVNPIPNPNATSGSLFVYGRPGVLL